MKHILAALLVLSAIAGSAGAAAAGDAKSFYEQQDRARY
jgi:hypothetical protein